MKSLMYSNNNNEIEVITTKILLLLIIIMWNSIAVYRPLPGLICKRQFLRACTEVLNVVVISSPGISIPAESVFPACYKTTAPPPDFRRALVGWALVTLLTSRNHLTAVVVMLEITQFQTRISWYWWLEPTCQAFPLLPQ